jgi:hypothetical protein
LMDVEWIRAQFTEQSVEALQAHFTYSLLMSQSMFIISLQFSTSSSESSIRNQ